MELLMDQLDGNGLDDIVEARIYLIDPRRDYRGFDRAWRRIFRGVDPLPAMSLIPSTQTNGDSGIMWPGPRIEIDLISKKQT
jgi:enamine deaminase RidA (YjgF/YER057c/UK114 family)